MAQIDIEIPDETEMRIRQLVDDGEFLDFEDAVKSLLSSGLTAYRTDNETTDDDFGSGYEDDFGPQDPAGRDDDYVF